MSIEHFPSGENPKTIPSDEKNPITEKVPSEGEEWVKRRKLAQQVSERHFRETRDVIGSSLLLNQDKLNRESEYWKNLEELKTPNVLIKHEIKDAENSTQRKYELLQKQLSLVALQRPEALENLLKTYFLSLTREELQKIKGELTSQISIAEPSQEDKSRFLALRLMGRSREQIEHEYLSTELTRHIRRSYEDNKMVLSKEMLIPILENHYKELLKREQQLLSEIPHYKEKIELLLIAAAHNGVLPIDARLIKERLDTLKYNVIDGVTAHLHETWGDYNAEDHRIRISSNVPDDQLWPVFAHEVMHALSGQTEIKIVLTGNELEAPKEQDPDFTSHEVIRLGTSITKPFSHAANIRDSEYRPQDFFWWLNEAITELTALELIKQEDSRSYKYERKILALLIAKGVPISLFRSAYFENYDTTHTPKEHTLPKTKELFEATNKRFGNGFLVNLSRFISAKSAENKKSGVRDVWRLCERNPEIFPQIIAQWAQSERTSNEKK